MHNRRELQHTIKAEGNSRRNEQLGTLAKAATHEEAGRAPLQVAHVERVDARDDVHARAHDVRQKVLRLVALLAIAHDLRAERASPGTTLRKDAVLRLVRSRECGRRLARFAARAIGGDVEDAFADVVDGVEQLERAVERGVRVAEATELKQDLHATRA